MGLTLVTAPASEPLTTAEAKSHLRVDITDDDTLIDAYVKAARQYVEEDMGRALITQTWDYTLDEFPADGSAIQIPRPPLQSVTSVTYVDSAGATQTLSSANYIVNTGKRNGEITLAYGQTWPATREQANAVTIRFVAGYGAASAVPETIKTAVRLTLGDLYGNREGSIVGATHIVNPAVAALLGPYRLVEIA